MITPLYGSIGPLGRQYRAAAGVDPRWDNLVAGWKLDEESDGSAPVARADVLGNYGLTDNNTTPSTTGILSNAVLPASANLEYLSSAAVPGIDGGDVTLCFWVKRVGNMPVGHIVSRYTGANANSSWAIYTNSATTIRLIVLVGAAQNFSGGSLTLTLDTWHMVTFRKASGTSVATLYRDDGLVSTTQTASLGQINSGAVDLTIGANATPAQYANNTAIDNVYYFSDLKDDTWVTSMYNSGAGRSYPN